MITIGFILLLTSISIGNPSSNTTNEQIIDTLFPPLDKGQEVFALSHQKSLFIELLKVLAFIMTKEPIEYLLFLIPFFKNYTMEEIIEKLEINYQMFNLLDQDNENISGEVQQLYKLLASKEDIQTFIKTHGLSRKFFDYTLKSIIISKKRVGPRLRSFCDFGFCR
jgi:hypothetical protein